MPPEGNEGKKTKKKKTKANNQLTAMVKNWRNALENLSFCLFKTPTNVLLHVCCSQHSVADIWFGLALNQ